MVYAGVPQNARNNVAALDFLDFREQNRSFTVMAATRRAGAPIAFSATETEIADTVSTARVTPGYFEALGIPPLVGRTFIDEDIPAGADVRPGVASDVAIVSDCFWRNRLGSNPAIIGQTIRLGSPPHTRRISAWCRPFSVARKCRHLGANAGPSSRGPASAISARHSTTPAWALPLTRRERT